MYDNERIFMQILDLAGSLEVEDIQDLINDLEVMIENKLEESESEE